MRRQRSGSRRGGSEIRSGRLALQPLPPNLLITTLLAADADPAQRLVVESLTACSNGRPFWR